METEKLIQQDITHSSSDKLNKKYLGIALLVITLISSLFIIRTIIDSTMNYNSQRAHILSYFTIQSNILVVLWSFGLSLYMLTGKKLYKFTVNINLSASMTTYILATGLVYWLVLVPMMYKPGATWFFSTSNIYLHTFTTVIAVIIFTYLKTLAVSDKTKPRLYMFYLYPLLYVIFAIANSLNNVYLYPIFNPNIVGGWIGVAICVVIICVIFTGIYLFLLYGKRKKRAIN